MKIISKFTDFYDYFGSCYGHDADNRVIYRRVPKYFRKCKLEHPIDIDKNRQSIYNNLLQYRNVSIELMNGKTSDNEVVGFIEFQVIGIYPEIRILPLISIYSKRDRAVNTVIYSINDLYSFRKESLLDIYTDRDIIFSMDNLIDISEIYNCKLRNIKIDNNGDLIIKSINYSTISFLPRIGYPIKIKKSDLTIENSEFFLKEIHSPIFYMSKYVTNRLATSSSDEESDYENVFNIVIDCNFSDLKNIDIEDIKKDINIRSRIESFFYKEKEMDENPEEPNNDVKIVSHGFDLKTSFRKV